MVHLLGIRHHGPGSARAVVHTLNQLKPDVVLVEGPPDAESILRFVPDGPPGPDDLEPPVAILVWAPDDTGRLARAVFYPFAAFSPEWQAFRWARQHGAALRLCDLSQTIAMLDDEDVSTGLAEGDAQGLDLLAMAAGYPDRDAWWEQEIELRYSVDEVFPAVAELMTAARDPLGPASRREARREASMREAIRAAERKGAQQIAVVVGAWHVPALTLDVRASTRKSDLVLLRGLPRTHTRATWIPWTYPRLGSKNGYGAGVASPGWYTHVWAQPDAPAVHWLARCAELLRAEGHEVSSAQVLDAVRLSETLAAIRELRRPGLPELQDAVQSVLCEGAPEPMRLIRARLDVGTTIGRVPAGVPEVPLATDVARRQRHLRLRLSPESHTLSLDLRVPRDREKSALLHQLGLLDVPWGRAVPVQGARGSFHEQWELAWNVEFPVRILEASIYGHTLPDAASARLAERLELADLTGMVGLLSAVMYADLPEMLDTVLRQLQARAAETGDVRLLIRSLGPLTEVLRYGDVRGAPPAGLGALVDELVVRVAVALPGVCRGLDDPGAAAMAAQLRGLPVVLARVGQASEIYAALASLEADAAAPPRIRGTALRLGLDADQPGSHRRIEEVLSLELSAAPREAVLWLEGLLTGSGALLMQHERLWAALDRFVAGLGRGAFVESLPMLRRAFSGFEPAERRIMAERLRRGFRGAPRGAVEIDAERAERVMPVVWRLLGG